jgi:nucleoside-diphosphate-sugar epimerase
LPVAWLEQISPTLTLTITILSPASIAQAFEDPEGKYDLVFNLAAETKYSQTEEVYNERVYLLTVNCAKEAAKQGVKMFVELSTAQVYDADKVRRWPLFCAAASGFTGILTMPRWGSSLFETEQKASDEGAKLKPWTLIAKAKLKAEEELKTIAGLVPPSALNGRNRREIQRLRFCAASTTASSAPPSCTAPGTSSASVRACFPHTCLFRG